MSNLLIGVFLMGLGTALAALIVGPVWMWAVPVLAIVSVSVKATATKA